MASAGVLYLPDLAKCFAGESDVFSWDEAFRHLTTRQQDLSPYLAAVLSSSPAARDLILQLQSGFPQASASARTSFETKTAAINVTPASDESYNLTQIKSDTLWLSDEVNLSEEEALRVVVLEWQQNPGQRLICGYSKAEIASLRNAVGDGGSEAGTLDELFPERTTEKLDTGVERRARLLLIYFRERAGLLGVTREVQGLASGLDDGSPHSSLKHIRGLAASMSELIDSHPEHVSKDLAYLRGRLEAINAGRSWSLNLESLNDLWAALELQCMRLYLELLLLRLRQTTRSTASEDVVAWFRLMTDCSFFAHLQPTSELQIAEIEQLQAVVALLSLALLDPTSTIGALNEAPITDMQQKYFLTRETAETIHNMLFSAAEACLPQATPSILAWASILNEIRDAALASRDNRENARTITATSTEDSSSYRSSSGSLQQSVFEDVTEYIMNSSPVPDPITYLLRCSIEAGHVYEVISLLISNSTSRPASLNTVYSQILQELISVAIVNTGYNAGILSSQFSILSQMSESTLLLSDPSEIFIKDDFLVSNIFDVAAARFPYESLSFLQLCRLLASARIFDGEGTQYIEYRLRSLTTFTSSSVGAFDAYHTVREDENLNLVALDSAASMLNFNQPKTITNYTTRPDLSIMPADTIGEVISESTPVVIRWQYQYSGLELLGSWLELHYLGQLQSLLSPFEIAHDIVAEIIGIFAALLSNTPTQASGPQQHGASQSSWLSAASTNLEGDNDVTGYIFEILEQELQAFKRRPTNTFNTSVIVNCVKFLTALVRTRPDRFWATFQRTSLVGSYGSESSIVAIIYGVEVSLQSFPLTEACIGLYHGMILAAADQFSQESTQKKPAKYRSLLPQTARAQASVLMSFTQSLSSVFGAMPSWIFSQPTQRYRIISEMTKAFYQVIYLSLGTGEAKSSHHTSFDASCELLLNDLRPPTENKVDDVPTLQHLVSIASAVTTINNHIDINHLTSPLVSLMDLCGILIRSRKLQTRSLAAFEAQVFSLLPLLIRLPVQDSSFTAPCLSLIQDLIDAVPQQASASLVGYLGSESSVYFLNWLISSRKLRDSTHCAGISWNLMRRLVGHSQQWLAIVVLTGAPPQREAVKADDEHPLRLRGKSILQIALGRLSGGVKAVDSAVVESMLGFVLEAQQNWSWVTSTLKGHQDFVPALVSYICNTYVDLSEGLKISHRNKIASQVTDLATILLHHAKAVKDTLVVRSFVPLIRWLSENAVEVSSYNSSLHGNLNKNFGDKFVGLKVVDFKRTGLTDAPYGEDYYYDVVLAGQILASHPSWNITSKATSQSFRTEFRRANLNLSLVDSEVAMLRSFRNLCLEHGAYLVQDKELQNTMTVAVKSCLMANMQPYAAENIFSDLAQTRAELIIALTQRLVEAQVKGSEVRALLPMVWDCIRTRVGSFEQAIANDDLDYWRSMLKVVLLTLNFHVDRRYQPPAANAEPAALLRHSEHAIPTILEILTVTVGQGLRTLTAAVQDQQQRKAVASQADAGTTVSSSDMLLVLTIFETILRMVRLPEFSSEAAQRLIASGAIQSCLLLYSWSHLLTDAGAEDRLVYAEHSLHALSLLSSLPQVAEEMAVEGVLTRLLSARMTQQLQGVPNGVGHLDKRPRCMFLYTLWAGGIVPICLNLLHSVGAPICSEVSMFLNQFPRQLERASNAFVPSTISGQGLADGITTESVRECATLALISFILDKYRSAGASAAVDPTTIMPLAGYDEHKKALASDITDLRKASVASLKARIVLTTESQADFKRGPDVPVKRVKQELDNAFVCLQGLEMEEEDK